MQRRRSIALLCLVCIALLGAVAVASGASAAVSAQVQSEEEQTYAVTQGDQCIEVRPLGNGSQTVAEFYDYRTPETHDYPDYRYSSYGTTHLQENDTSILTLYEGSDGVALVLVHGHVTGGNSSGGALTMQFEGLPAEGEWVVEDDSYSDDHQGGAYDTFEHEGDESRITWVYTDNRTDGAAFRGGLDDEFELTIDPAFNDDADFRVYEGDLEDWQVLSAAGDGHTRTSLDSMDEPVTIGPGGCPSLTVTTVTTTPSEPDPGEPVDIDATVTNDGSEAGTFTATVTADGDVVDERTVSLDPGETDQFTTTTRFDEEAVYEVAVEETTAEVTVAADSETAGSTGGDDTIPGFGVTAAIGGVLAAISILARSRRA